MKTLITIAVSLFALTAFAAENPVCKDDAHYPIVSKKDLKGIVAANQATIFDVNSADSFKSNHVPGAVHYESHEKDFSKFLPADKSALIVAYCGGPMCEAWKTAAERACNMGYTNVKHFKDGISGWTKKD